MKLPTRALRQPLCQALQIDGKGVELADRLEIAFGRHRYEMTLLSAIDAGGIGLDAFEQPRLMPAALIYRASSAGRHEPPTQIR